MLIFDDTAIFRTQDGYVRPSDLLDQPPTQLLTVTSNGHEKWSSFTVSKTVSAYARIRFSHGVVLNAGYENIMVGTIHTGYKGCEPKTTLDVVSDIQKNFKYQYYEPAGWLSGDEEYIIDLAECTDKKSGTFNIATPDMYTLFGWAARTFKKTQYGCSLSANNRFVEPYLEFCKKVPLDILSIDKRSIRTTFRLRENWLTDVLLAFIGDYNSERFVADDLLFHATPELATNFRDGFVNCAPLNPPIKYKNVLRYSTSHKINSISDLAFLIRKSGRPTFIINNADNSYRIAECVPRWSHYVQEVEHTDAPKEMYSINPIKDRGVSPLWVNGILFNTKQ